jgi:N6-L-threonylcarbamoyladenine synthase
VTITRVFGIETSCDETSAAVVEYDGRTFSQRSLVILSQDVHRLFGGVVPEIASRQHLTALPPVVRAAMRDADDDARVCDAIAVTHAPGLVGALLVGVHYAKALGLARGCPCCRCITWKATCSRRRSSTPRPSRPSRRCW